MGLDENITEAPTADYPLCRITVAYHDDLGQVIEKLRASEKLRTVLVGAEQIADGTELELRFRGVTKNNREWVMRQLTAFDLIDAWEYYPEFTWYRASSIDCNAPENTADSPI